METSDLPPGTRIEPNYAGAIYGIIISMTVVATASKDDSVGPVAVAIWAAVTSLVFWLVHVYADIVGAGYSTPKEAVKHARGALRNEWPIVQGGMIPAIAMLLAAIGLFNEENASYVAVGAGILALFATGLVIGSKDRRDWGRRILIGAVNAFFGLLILALKIFIH